MTLIVQAVWDLLNNINYKYLAVVIKSEIFLL